jgi:hypothetical protein
LGVATLTSQPWFLSKDELLENKLKKKGRFVMRDLEVFLEVSQRARRAYM